MGSGTHRDCFARLVAILSFLVAAGGLAFNIYIVNYHPPVNLAIHLIQDNRTEALQVKLVQRESDGPAPEVLILFPVAIQVINRGKEDVQVQDIGIQGKSLEPLAYTFAGTQDKSAAEQAAQLLWLSELPPTSIVQPGRWITCYTYLAIELVGDVRSHAEEELPDSASESDVRTIDSGSLLAILGGAGTSSGNEQAYSIPRSKAGIALTVRVEITDHKAISNDFAWIDGYVLPIQ